VIFTSNFFEHLPDKPSLGRTLAEAFRCLKPGRPDSFASGRTSAICPAPYWDFWDHYLPLTERSLVEGLELAGFRGPSGSGIVFLPYTMSQERNPPPVWMLRLYLRLPIVWPIFGRQIPRRRRQGRRNAR